MSKFREWCLLMLWYIPEQKWGNLLVYHEGEDDTERLELDLNLLLNTLEQLYYINLTRGKGGFTVRELNTSRAISRTEPQEVAKRGGGIRLF